MILQGTSARRATRRRRVAVLAVIAATVALSGCTSGGEPKVETPKLAEGNLNPELVSSMEHAVNVAIQASGSSGAIVGVWIPWSGSWVAGVGTTELGGATPMDPAMAFRAGDITRSMTCDVFYGLAEDGRIDPQAKVSDSVPGVANLSNMTLEQLCDSSSGLVDIGGMAQTLTLQSPGREWQPRELASYGLVKAPVGTPGGGYVDSDTGYLLLGMALERASGQKMSTLIQQYIASPLSLSATTLPKAEAAAPSEGGPAGYLTPFADGAWQCATPTNVTTVSSMLGFSDSGVVSTVEELGVYARATAEKSLGYDEDGKRYDSPLQISDSLPTWYTASGGVKHAGDLMGQDGSMLGYSSAMWSDPKTGVTVVVMLNNSTNAGGIVRDLSLELVAMAATAPAASGQTVPEFGVPWTAEAQDQSVRAQAICPVTI